MDDFLSAVESDPGRYLNERGAYGSVSAGFRFPSAPVEKAVDID